MPTCKQIVCLANSRKLSGRCIAGKERSGDQILGWLRPISARVHEEVSEHERQYEDGSDPRVLDIITIPLIEHRPRTFQSENWLLNPDHYWEKEGVLSWTDLEQFTDPADQLWTINSSTYNGSNDQVALNVANTLTSSLRLIFVDQMTLRVFAPGAAFNNPKRRVQAQFSHSGHQYWLWVTDPKYERDFLAKPNGNYQINSAYLTISLGEPHNDFCYKLVAAIIEQG